MKKIVLAANLVVLITLLFTFVIVRLLTGNSTIVDVDKLMESTFRDYTYKVLPLGENKYLSERTIDLLDFDRSWNRRYFFEDLSIDVLITYWRNTSKGLRVTTMHNPDNCWVRFGEWKELERHREVSLPDTIGIAALRNMVEYGFYEDLDGNRLHVYFFQSYDKEFVPVRPYETLKFVNRVKEKRYFNFLENEKSLVFIRFISTEKILPFKKDNSSEVDCFDCENISNLLKSCVSFINNV